MKLLFAYYRYSPHSNGPSIYIDTLRKMLQDKGHTVDLLSHDKDWLNIQISNQQKVNKYKIKNTLIDRFQTSYSTKYPLWIFWREMERLSLEKAIKQLDLNEYDLIHCHDFMTARAIALSKPSHTRFVVSLHNFKYHESKITKEFYAKSRQEQQYMKTEEYIGAMSGDVVAVPCEWLKKQLIKIGVTPLNIKVIPYGITKEPFMTSKISKIGEDKKVILCPARLVPIKGQRYLLKALWKLSREREDFHCLLAGEGPDRTALQQLANNLGISSIISFLGKRNDIPYLMNKSDIIVLPSLHDTFPLVILEGQFSAKPVIATNVGGMKEIMTDGADGLIAQSADSEALAEKLRFLLDHSSIRSQIGKQALRKAMNYWDIDRHIKSIEKLYQQTKTRSVQDKQQIEREILSQCKTIKSVESGFTLSGDIHEELRKELTNQQHYIHLYDQSGVLLQTKPVNPNGSYEFQWLPAGSYVLKSTLEKFGNETKLVGPS
ncbi:glycosyltransferase family 4 protein [Bacillus changyiensis]|uniref:glycosyltransferase family 4 protein n=1 Tax=Bacillus changyiensis TaxID=3004103 RepID=UPI0022E0AB4A|nr:glycosyltransferase family 4 protein [Bacillus changyiensis]MDA1475145.1 glycosyltransferase family 4 protein [Bacillus changyiensis]